MQLRTLVFGLFFLLGGVNFLSAQCLSGNCKNGIGTYLYPSGAKYTGDFINNQINGKGMLIFSNGDIYEGQWKDNYRAGTGELKFKSGDKYNGEFHRSQFHGKGLMRYNDGDTYSGYWMGDQANGEGIYNFNYGDRYEGAFKAGKFHGQGVYYSSDGARFEGSWRENLKHGDGLHISPQGDVQSSNWAYGEEIIKSQIEGELSSDINVSLADCNSSYCDNDEGIFHYEDGSFFKGHFINGLPQGQGICYYQNGDKYIGGWKHHSPHGNGVMYFRSGRAYGATWNEGQPIKELDLKQSINLRSRIPIEKSAESKTWAVIIGIAEYKYMPQLKFADDDAYRMYSFLKSYEGGQIPESRLKLMINKEATRSNILNALQDVYLMADDNDVILLYYSGHGLKGSFIPIDYNGYENKLHHQDIKYIFDQSQAGVKIVLADACYSGSFDMDGNAELLNTANNTAFLMSSTSQEVSLEGGGLDQGIFSHYLMRALHGEADTNKDKQISIQELYDFVYLGVRNSSGNTQSPVITGLYDRHMPISVLP